LPSPCHRATPFAALSESQEGSHALPGVSPPRVSCIFARPCVRCAGLLAGSSRRRSSRVLADSSNWDLVTVTVFPPQVETPRGFSLGQPTVSNRRQPPRSMFAYTGCVRPQAVGTGERLPRSASRFGSGIPGSQARQLHLTFLRFPGIISELLGAGLSALAFSPSFSQRTARTLQKSRKRVNRNPT
jgi:hypothetical protein